MNPVIRGRAGLLLIAAVFLVPLVAAAWLYYSGQGLQPEGRTNAGRLLQPIVNVNEALSAADRVSVTPATIPDLTDGASSGKWVLLYRNSADCTEACVAALYRMRQSRLMLGRDMTRVVRVFLHGDIPPDKVLLETEHEGLITISNSDLDGVLDRKRPADLAPGGLFLIDPLGNLVMYFAAELTPEAMVDDIEHLLDLSRIG